MVGDIGWDTVVMVIYLFIANLVFALPINDVHCEDRPRLVMSRFEILVAGECFFFRSLIPFRIPSSEYYLEPGDVATFLSKRGLSMFKTIKVILGPAIAFITSRCV